MRLFVIIKYVVVDESKDSSPLSLRCCGARQIIKKSVVDESKDSSPLSLRCCGARQIIKKSQVIQGWEQGVLGMKVGEKSKLTISPDLGSRGHTTQLNAYL